MKTKSNKLRLNVIALILLGTILFVCCKFKWITHSYLVNCVLPFTVVIMLACMYSSYYFHNEKLFLPSRYLQPIYIAISASFGIVSIMFGFHTDVLTRYDRHDMNKQGKKSWLQVDRILEYPKQQFADNSHVPLTQINFSELKDTFNTCHIIIIDKTESVVDVSDSINHFIWDICNNTYSLDTSFKTNTIDLLAPFHIAGLYTGISNDTFRKDVMCVFIYDGITEEFINVKEDPESANYIVKLSDLKKNKFISNYFEKIAVYNQEIIKTRPKQKSSLKEVIKILKEKLENVDDLKRNGLVTGLPYYNKYTLTIISDFINTDSTEKGIDILTLDKIDETYTYALPGKDRNISYLASDLLRDMFNNVSPEKYSNVDLTNIENLQGTYYSLLLLSFEKYKSIDGKPIEFYQPYEVFGSDRACQFKFNVTDIFPPRLNSKLMYYLKIADLDLPENRVDYFVECIGPESRKQFKGRLGHFFPIELGRSDTVFVTLLNPDNIRSNRLVFEIASHEAHKSKACIISFLPTLPKTTSYYLIICYCIFLFGISFILVLPNFFVFWIIFVSKTNTESKKYFDPLSLLLPIAIGIAMIIALFCFYGLEFIGFTLTVFFGLSIFSLPSLRRSLLDELKLKDNQMNKEGAILTYDKIKIYTFDCCPLIKNKSSINTPNPQD